MKQIDYSKKLKYHYRPKKGWINDPNGLVYFKGYYHVFYQHAPDHEIPWKQAIHWGHARTKNFLDWEELPIAISPDTNYDCSGCWSGTAIVKDDRLYLFYAAITAVSTVAVAYSDDGINFTKYEGNPVISTYPPEGGPDFRDPAVCCINGSYYCVMASGNEKEKMARLLLYKSNDLLNWEYKGVMCEWENCKYAECPSFMAAGDMCLLTASVCPLDKDHFFSVMYGDFDGSEFKIRSIAQVDKGPDQYAGQVFKDHLDRNILISWMPGWKYSGYYKNDIGCFSLPREITLTDGKIQAYPIQEVRHLLTTDDPCLKITESGFVVERTGRDPLVYEGEITDIKILRDGYIAEIYVNGGEEIYSALL